MELTKSFKKEFDELFANFSLGERTRYSEEELAFWKRFIEANISRIKEFIEMKRKSLEDNSTRDTDGRVDDFNNMDTGTFYRNGIVEEISRAEKKLYGLNCALERTKAKCFGICMKTGQLIHPQRLLCVPQATVGRAAFAAAS